MFYQQDTRTLTYCATTPSLSICIYLSFNSFVTRLKCDAHPRGFTIAHIRYIFARAGLIRIRDGRATYNSCEGRSDEMDYALPGFNAGATVGEEGESWLIGLISDKLIEGFRMRGRFLWEMLLFFFVAGDTRVSWPGFLILGTRLFVVCFLKGNRTLNS